MTGHSTYVPKSALARWFESRLPIMGLVHSSFIAYPTPKNLNYWWTFGGIATFMLTAQIVTGVVLAMTSCKSPAAIVCASSPASARRYPTSAGCTKYGSPEYLFCSL